MNFARKLNQFAQVYTELDKNLRHDLTKLFILSRVSETGALGTPAQARASAARITELLLISKYRRILSGANLFDNVWWFNKEICDNSLNLIELLMFMNAKASEVSDVLKLFKELRASKLKAAYKCEAFAKAFEPVEKKKPAAAKKKAAAKKAIAAKKTSTAKKATEPKKSSTTKKAPAAKKATSSKKTSPTKKKPASKKKS